MGNSYFQFKQFTIQQDRCAMKVTTDACLFGAWVADDIQKDKKAKTLLDIGAGTGLLSLMIAQKNSGIEIDAIEIDKDAAEQATGNIAASVWKHRINIINDDVKNFKLIKKYNLLVSNPPFYENELQSDNNQKNIAHHSEALSLDNLLDTIKQNINTTGSFYLLLPHKRNDEIEPLLNKYGFCISHRVNVRQTVNHSFFRIMIKAGLQNTLAIVEEISIKDTNKQYTKRFTDQLKDYYLYL